MRQEREVSGKTSLEITLAVVAVALVVVIALEKKLF